jgi:GTP-binding protein
MMPLIASVGRPNVGKSTLFNRLIGERKAIVLDTPGVTRDRNYGDVYWNQRTFTVIDTGGFEPKSDQSMLSMMRHQAMLAIEEADLVIFVADCRDGLMEADREVAHLLRRGGSTVLLAVNKVDGNTQHQHAAEFYGLGLEEVFSISAEHGRGVGRLLDKVTDLLPPAEEEESEDQRVTRVALIGRPNVGKSTLANRLLGDERMIVSDVPGTTRDAIDARMVVDGREYTLIDTAGLRRKRGIKYGTSEGYSVVRTMRAIERCHVAVVLLDSSEGITEQDVRIIGLAVEKGRALILVFNKWDAIDKDAKTADRIKEQVEMKIPFARWAPILHMSGLTGLRVNRLMGMVATARDGHLKRISTAPLNRWLELCLQRHQPPVVRNKRLRLYYATQARTAPPTIVLSCNDPQSVHFSYKRFLENQFRDSFDVHGTPIRLIFKGKKPEEEEE